MDLDAEETSEETTLKPLEESSIIVGRADWASPYEEGHQEGLGVVGGVTESTTKEPILWPSASFQTFVHTPSIAHLPLEPQDGVEVIEGDKGCLPAPVLFYGTVQGVQPTVPLLHIPEEHKLLTCKLQILICVNTWPSTYSS